MTGESSLGGLFDSSLLKLVISFRSSAGRVPQPVPRKLAVVSSWADAKVLRVVPRVILFGSQQTWPVSFVLFALPYFKNTV